MSVMQIPGHDHQKPGEVMLEEIDNCKRCELGQTRSHIVFGCGNPHARVMFVGEGPGRNEDLKGEPFVGAAGHKLDALLSVTIVSILAYVVANLLRVDPYYEHLLADLLGVTPDDPSINGEPGEKVLKTVYVDSGSRLEGMRVSEVPWPDGTRIVTIDRAGQEIVPNGETRLLALDGLLLIMDSEFEDDVMLKVGLMSEQRV